jgi:hypothetical protein
MTTLDRVLFVGGWVGLLVLVWVLGVGGGAR